MTDKKPPFDATTHLRRIRTKQGMQEYLDVKWRIAWLRSEHPEAQIVTEQIEGDEKHARFKCTIRYMVGIARGSDGPAFEAVGTGHGSETVNDFPDFYEKAETKAVGRACAILGYGTEMADLAEGPPDRQPRVQLGDRLTQRQQAYLAGEAIQRGIRLSEQQQLWSTVMSQLSKAGVDLEGVADDAGIIAEEVVKKLLAVPLVRQPGSAPPAQSRPPAGPA
jgi:hypothetical protein